MKLIHFIYVLEDPIIISVNTANQRKESYTMIIPAITYIVFAIAGLLGSAIAWDDFRGTMKMSQKVKKQSTCS